MSEQRIVEVVAGIAASSREPLYAFTSEQVEALKTLGLKMIPVREDRIVEGVLEDLREAGFDVYRPDECAAVGIGRWVEYEGRAVARMMTPPPPEIEPGTYRLVPVREDS